MCHFVLVFFSPFSIAITSLGEERANLSAFRMFVRFVLVLICRFPLPLGVWEGLRIFILFILKKQNKTKQNKKKKSNKKKTKKKTQIYITLPRNIAQPSFVTKRRRDE